MKDYSVIFETETKKYMPKLEKLRQGKTYKSTDEFLNDKETYQAFLNSLEINDTTSFPAADPKGGKKSFGDFAFGTIGQSNYIELYGYFMFKYQTPWYDDNLGSFLIVVETSSN